MDPRQQAHISIHSIQSISAPLQEMESLNLFQFLYMSLIFLTFLDKHIKRYLRMILLSVIFLCLIQQVLPVVMTPSCAFALAALLQQVLQPRTFHRAVEAHLDIPFLQPLLPVCLGPPILHATVLATHQLHLVSRLVSTNKD